MAAPAKPDQIIEELGGCGRFQIHVTIIVHLIKTIVCFSILSTIIISATPPWRCIDSIDMNNGSSCLITRNGSDINICPYKACTILNDTKCSKFAFEGSLQSVVSEVCKHWTSLSVAEIISVNTATLHFGFLKLQILHTLYLYVCINVSFIYIFK